LPVPALCIETVEKGSPLAAFRLDLLLHPGAERLEIQNPHMREHFQVIVFKFMHNTTSVSYEPVRRLEPKGQ